MKRFRFLAAILILVLAFGIAFVLPASADSFANGKSQIALSLEPDNPGPPPKIGDTEGMWRDQQKVQASSNKSWADGREEIILLFILIFLLLIYCRMNSEPRSMRMSYQPAMPKSRPNVPPPPPPPTPTKR